MFQPLEPVSLPFPISEYTRDLLEQTMEMNQNIRTSRGKGWLTLNTRKMKARFRMVWAAMAPGQVRISLMDSGHPVETIISNGKHIHFFSHTGSHKPCTIRVTSRDILYFFSVDLPPYHMTRLLLGQIPIFPFTKVSSFPLDRQYSGAVITENNKTFLKQKLIWDNQGNIHQILVEKKSRDLVYAMTFHTWIQTGQYRIPSIISINNEKEGSITLHITDLHPNASVTPSIFQLTQSGSSHLSLIHKILTAGIFIPGN